MKTTAIPEEHEGLSQFVKTYHDDLWSGPVKVPLRCYGRILNGAVHAWKPYIAAELKQFCKEEWAEIPPQQYERLVSSYRRCLVAIVAAKGCTRDSKVEEIRGANTFIFACMFWRLICLVTVTNINICFYFLVRCIRNTPAYFAERLHKAMQVHLFFIITFIFINTNQSFVALKLLWRERRSFHWSSQFSVTLCCVDREQAPRTELWSASWCPALRSICWTSDRSTWRPTENHCTLTFQ